jgi:uncharacterized iron-regulated protein
MNYQTQGIRMELARGTTIYDRWLAWTLAILLTGCSAAGQQPSDTTLVHPLTGLIWDVRQEQFADYPALVADAVSARHVLLGETHINPEHHRIQAEIIQDLVNRGHAFALVFEIFERDQQEAIDRVLSDPQATSDDVATATGIEDSGWDWPAYEPLVQLALADELPILAGNAPRREVRQIAQAGLDAIPEDEQVSLGLSAPLPHSAKSALTEVIIDSHCGYVSGEMAGRLVDAQRLRDATLADVVLQADADRTVLIAGAGHVRRDYGVPVYILERTPAAELLAIGLVEVASDLTAPGDYLERLEDRDVPFDYLWFTSRTMSEDPCEQFRKSLEKMHSTEPGR